MSAQAFSSFLANLILLTHASVVVFIVGALPVTWIGYFRNWKFVRNPSFRLTHLALIAIVVGESVFGAVCPLTTWEDVWLTRAGAGPRYQRGFIPTWIHRLVFYDLDQRVFTIAYSLFLLLVVFTFIWIRPQWGRRPRPSH